ncbi:hypothetical protein AB5I41_02575 [Sphingomonas sp. MMS24-JH45]
MNQVLVYKSPMASIVGQGLSGTVDLRTIRPLNMASASCFGRCARQLHRSRQAERRVEGSGYRLTGTYVDQFADDRIGVSLAASYVD